MTRDIWPSEKNYLATNDQVIINKGRYYNVLPSCSAGLANTLYLITPLPINVTSDYELFNGKFRYSLKCKANRSIEYLSTTRKKNISNSTIIYRILGNRHLLKCDRGETYLVTWFMVWRYQFNPYTSNNYTIFSNIVLVDIGSKECTPKV